MCMSVLFAVRVTIWCTCEIGGEVFGVGSGGGGIGSLGVRAGDGSLGGAGDGSQ